MRVPTRWLLLPMLCSMLGADPVPASALQISGGPAIARTT
jgi:hypothetical protein